MVGILVLNQCRKLVDVSREIFLIQTKDARICEILNIRIPKRAKKIASFINK